MTLSIIVAMSKNGVIGNEGKLPWHLPEDLKHFKQITSGHAIIMGRKTYESIGKPLPLRKNIVITHDRNLKADPSVVIVSGVAEAIAAANSFGPESFVIGGSEIYKLFLHMADKMYVTLIDQEMVGDAYYPDLEWEKKFESVESKNLISEKSGMRFKFINANKKS